MLIKEFFSDSGHRRSLINLSKEVLSVDFYEGGVYISSIEYPGKSVQYVNDAAENWVLGILNDVKDSQQ